MTTCGEHLVALLEQRGVRTVFGIPGVHTLEIYRGLADSGIRHVTARHEQGAGFMADGWSRVADEPGVALVITGPGVTNAMTPLGQARHDGTPLLVVSASVRSDHLGRGLGVIHDLPDQSAMTATVTRRTVVVRDPAGLEAAVAEAWDVLTGADGPRGPVHLEVPTDLLRAPAEPVAVDRRHGADGPPASAVAEAARMLAAAERPAIILGGGARHAGASAIAIAEALGAPIGLTINAKGAVPGDHPLCVPSRMMFAPYDRLFADADVVLVLGSQLSDLDWWAHPDGYPGTGAVIRVDADPVSLSTHVEPTLAIGADAAATATAIAAAVGAGDGARAEAVAADIAAAGGRVAWPADVARFLPAVRAMDAALPRDRIVCVDSTQLGYAANHALDVHLPGSWLMPIGFGCLGPALPMAIGARLAAPTRPVLAIVGDGGLLFTLQELATARDLGLPLPVVVWNNAGYGEIRDAMAHASMPAIGTDATAHDISAIARGFGCRAERPTDVAGFGAAIEAALGADGPTVVELTPSTEGILDAV